MKKIIGTTKVHNEKDGSMQTDIDLTELKPIVERLNELGVKITLREMAKIVESTLKRPLSETEDVRFLRYTLVTYPQS